MYREKRVFICNCQATCRKALRLNPSCSLLSFSFSYYWSFWNHYLRSGFKSVSLVVVKITERFFGWVFWFWFFLLLFSRIWILDWFLFAVVVPIMEICPVCLCGCLLNGGVVAFFGSWPTWEYPQVVSVYFTGHI